MICNHCCSLVDNTYEFIDSKNYNGFSSAKVLYLCNNCIKKLNIDIRKNKCDNCHYCYMSEEEIDQSNHFCYYCLRNTYINKYIYRPDPIFFKNEKDDFCIGVELELNGADTFFDLKKSVDSVNELFTTINPQKNTLEKFCYIKHDSSIGRKGYEIVTHPASLDYHKNEVPWKLFFKKYSMKGRAKCGLHFHVDKNFLNDIEIKFLDIVFNYSSPIIEIIAGRKMNNYCYTDKTKSIEYLGSSINRHQIINFQNSHTIEFRCFKSPKSYQAFMYRMEFVDAIMNFMKYFCSKNNCRYNENYLLSGNFKMYEFWDSFCDFVKSKNDKYFFLNDFIIENAKFKDVCNRYRNDIIQAKIGGNL